MILHYNASGKERKRLADVIAKEIGVDAKYMGAPTFAYQMDYFTVDKEGSLSFDENPEDDEVKRVLARIKAAGFEDTSEQCGLNIQIGMDGIDGDAISRLESLIESKAGLIRKALGTDSLMVGESDGKLEFDWFKGELSAEETKAYMNFVASLVKMAKESKRITATEKPVENEKYAFRCFLLRLGFIGDEYKTDRKILLKNFTGSSAFKGGAKDEISK